MKAAEVKRETLLTILSDLVPELELHWQNKANCRGVNPSLFYPERGVSTSEAKNVCAGCEVSNECLEFAVQNGEKFGIWGGLSERERRTIRRSRRLRIKEAEAEARKLEEEILQKAVGSE